MPILTQKAALLAKVETTPGTDAAPTAALDAILVTDPQFSVDATVLDRNFARLDFSSFASVVGRKLAQIQFSVPLYLSGTQDIAPKWATLLQGCGMAETSVAVGPPDGKQYDPITDNMKTLTLHLYFEGLLHKVTGAMGSFTLTAEAGNFATLNFTFTGNYVEPLAGTFPAAAVIEDVVPPIVESAAFTFGGSSAYVIQSFSFDMANTIVPRQDANSPSGFNGVRITGRNPTGGFNPEVETSHDFWARMSASTLSTLSARIGPSTEGRNLQISAPKVQIAGIAYADRDGLRTYDLSAAFRRSSGNDEIRFLFD